MLSTKWLKENDRFCLLEEDEKGSRERGLCIEEGVK